MKTLIGEIIGKKQPIEKGLQGEGLSSRKRQLSLVLEFNGL